MTTIKHCYKYIIIEERTDGRFYVNVPGIVSIVSPSLQHTKDMIDEMAPTTPGLPLVESEYQCGLTPDPIIGGADNYKLIILLIAGFIILKMVMK